MMFLVFTHLREALTIFFSLQVKLVSAASDEHLLFANDSKSGSMLRSQKSGYSVFRLPDGRNYKGEKYKTEAAKREGRKRHYLTLPFCVLFFLKGN